MDYGRRRWMQAGTGAVLGSMTGMFSSGGRGLSAYAQGGTEQVRSVGLAFPNSPLNSGDPNFGADNKMPPEAYNGPWKNMRAVKAKKVLDCHAHGYTPDQGKGNTYKEEIKVRASTPWLDKTKEQLEDMDRHGVAQAAVTADFIELEVYNEAKYSKHPDRFIRTASKLTKRIKDTTGDISPQMIAEEYRKQLQNGAKIIGESTYMLGTRGNYTVKDLKPIVDVILEYDVAVQIHTGWTAAYGGSTHYPYNATYKWTQQMGDLMSSYPEMKVIMAHAGGSTGLPDGAEALRLLYSYDNSYIDTSKTTPEVVSEAVRGVGAERVLFGTDWTHPELVTYGPIHFRACYLYWYNLNTIALANITEDQRDWILYKSARKIMKLPEA